MHVDLYMLICMYSRCRLICMFTANTQTRRLMAEKERERERDREGGGGEKKREGKGREEGWKRKEGDRMTNKGSGN